MSPFPRRVLLPTLTPLPQGALPPCHGTNRASSARVVAVDRSARTRCQTIIAMNTAPPPRRVRTVPHTPHVRVAVFTSQTDVWGGHRGIGDVESLTLLISPSRYAPLSPVSTVPLHRPRRPYDPVSVGPYPTRLPRLPGADRFVAEPNASHQCYAGVRTDNPYHAARSPPSLPLSEIISMDCGKCCPV